MGKFFAPPHGGWAEAQKIFDTNVCANAIIGIFICSPERLKFKVACITYGIGPSQVQSRRYWGVLPLQVTPWLNPRMCGHQDTPGSSPVSVPIRQCVHWHLLNSVRHVTAQSAASRRPTVQWLLCSQSWLCLSAVSMCWFCFHVTVH